jgi:hypothetical protein
MRSDGMSADHTVTVQPHCRAISTGEVMRTALPCLMCSTSSVEGSNTTTSFLKQTLPAPADANP